MTSCFPPSPTIARPPIWPPFLVPSLYAGIGVAAIVATCTAPIAAIIPAKTRLGNACVIASAVAIPACAISTPFCHLACFCCNFTFSFSSSSFFLAVSASAARFRASPSSVLITPLSTRDSILSTSALYAFSLASCFSSISLMSPSYIAVIKPPIVPMASEDISIHCLAFSILF